jgi:hypothetical protein
MNNPPNLLVRPQRDEICGQFRLEHDSTMGTSAQRLLLKEVTIPP